MAQQDGPTSPRKHRDPSDHRTTTVEKGRFCSAHCTCGWRGPARRARSLAREDAAGHAGA
ncbi:hypothetical protein [Streptomyces viridochromogenes]|uniref:hypothetical protein n=1 Tax=Streptomyces viridochromogenes TaxID=1938 RepID=UPI00099686C6|nr:hypothetical protein [Streptomyces viridochromogenes]